MGTSHRRVPDRAERQGLLHHARLGAAAARPRRPCGRRAAARALLGSAVRRSLSGCGGERRRPPVPPRAWLLLTEGRSAVAGGSRPEAAGAHTVVPRAGQGRRRRLQARRTPRGRRVRLLAGRGAAALPSRPPRAAVRLSPRGRGAAGRDSCGAARPAARSPHVTGEGAETLWRLAPRRWRPLARLRSMSKA